jgi:hypothetical protein
VHVKAVDLSHFLGVVIMIFTRAVLAEADNSPTGSGGQYPATSVSLRAHDLAPIADRVRDDSLAVPRLARMRPIRHLPGKEMQVS